MKQTYKNLANRAGCIRRKYKLTPLEAAWCALWLAGVDEPNISGLADLMDSMRAERYKDRKGAPNAHKN